MNAIELTNVTKIYRRYSGRQFATLKSALLQRSILRDLQASETFPALTDVSFIVPKGSTYGVIGKNGSGKSTALKPVAGITKPTSGTVRVDGRTSALIELGAGFHPEISGRENVFINGIMLGLTRREIARRFDEIVEFAELKDFIDAPVKTYSSGMYMRLGFAVAIHVNPDVLLVDEVLAGGDAAGGSGTARRSDQRHVPGDRRALGIARGRDHAGDPSRSLRPAVLCLPFRRVDGHSSAAARHAADNRFRVRHRPVQRRRRVLLWDQYVSGRHDPGASGG